MPQFVKEIMPQFVINVFWKESIIATASYEWSGYTIDTLIAMEAILTSIKILLKETNPKKVLAETVNALTKMGAKVDKKDEFVIKNDPELASVVKGDALYRDDDNGTIFITSKQISNKKDIGTVSINLFLDKQYVDVRKAFAYAKIENTTDGAAAKHIKSVLFYYGIENIRADEMKEMVRIFRKAFIYFDFDLTHISFAEFGEFLTKMLSIREESFLTKNGDGFYGLIA